MDDDVRRCVTRVRLLALRALVDAGGEPRPAQVARAIALAPKRCDRASTAGSASLAAVVKETDRPRRKRRNTAKGAQAPPWKETA